MINKSLITNLLSILIIIVGYFYQDKYSFIIITGVFALSGSITNWLAIHMLFENHNDIVTASEGEGERRHIILMKRDDNDS